MSSYHINLYRTEELQEAGINIEKVDSYFAILEQHRDRNGKTLADRFSPNQLSRIGSTEELMRKIKR